MMAKNRMAGRALGKAHAKNRVEQKLREKAKK